MKISIFTSMTNPEERGDPWREALNCYKDLADELIIVGQDWHLSLSSAILEKFFRRVLIKALAIG